MGVVAVGVVDAVAVGVGCIVAVGVDCNAAVVAHVVVGCIVAVVEHVVVGCIAVAGSAAVDEALVDHASGYHRFWNHAAEQEGRRRMQRVVNP